MTGSEKRDPVCQALCFVEAKLITNALVLNWEDTVISIIPFVSAWGFS